MSDCAAPRHPEPASAEPSARLCRGCRLDLARDLRHLPARYAEIEDMLDPRRAGDTLGGTGGGLPVSEPVTDWRSQVTHDLGVWVKWVISERQPGAWPLPAITPMCAWLHAQVQWISFRPWAGDMAGTFTDLRHQAISILDPRPPTQFIIPAAQNWCPACEASGLLRILRRSSVACGGCGHEWDPTQLLRLGTVILRNTRREAA